MVSDDGLLESLGELLVLFVYSGLGSFVLGKILFDLLLNCLFSWFVVFYHRLLKLSFEFGNFTCKGILVTITNLHKSLSQSIFVVLHMSHRHFHGREVCGPMFNIDLEVCVTLLCGFLRHYAGNLGLRAEEGRVVIE